jgi:hypothetical protein
MAAIIGGNEKVSNLIFGQVVAELLLHGSDLLDSYKGRRTLSAVRKVHTNVGYARWISREFEF